MRAHEDGSVEAFGWGFSPPELAGTGTSFEAAPSGGLLNGWTAYELHAIAHGVPCDCPIGRAHAAGPPAQP